MAGGGLAFDNILVERLWWTVKYEEVYMKSCKAVAEVRKSLARYFHFYNTEKRGFTSLLTTRLLRRYII